MLEAVNDIDAPTLVAVAHGTGDPDGVMEIHRLLEIVRSQRPDVPVVLCWLERAQPRLAETLAEIAGPVVIVPVLLSTGYHVEIDIPSVLGTRRATVISPPLGPDERISQVVHQRLEEASSTGRKEPSGSTEREDQTVILIGAGSSNPAARVELAQAARHLEHWIQGPVAIGQLTDADPFASAAAATRVANYLLAPGYFDDRLRELASSKVVAGPVGAHPLVGEVICDRYAAGVNELRGAASSPIR